MKKGNYSMKKSIAIVCAMAVCASTLLSGCGKKNTSVKEEKAAEETASIDDVELEISTPDTADEAKTPEVVETKSESDTKSLAVMTRRYYENYFDENNGYKQIAESTAEGIEIMDEGYEGLKASLKEFSENAHKGAEEFSKEAKEAYEFNDNETIGVGSWFYEAPIKLQRADSKALSFFTLDSSFTGGAHPYSFYVGYTYDSQSGKLLELKDIAADYEGIKSAVIDKIKNFEYADDLFDEWEDTVNSSFSDASGEDNSGVKWAISQSELRIIYNPYDIGPYAMGMVDIRLPFSEYPDLVKLEYTDYSPKAVYRPDAEYGVYYMEFNIDTDGDGNNEVITLNSEDIYTDEYNPEIDFDHASDFVIGMKCSAGYGKTNEDAQNNAIEIDAELSVQNAYVMEGNAGKYYLYLETSGYNDYRSLSIYDLSDPSKGLVEIPYQGGAFYGFVPMDSEHFYIADRVNVMGTYLGYRECYIGDDGLPVPYDEDYKLAYNDSEMTLLKDMNGLKAGTKLVPYLTNGTDTMKFMLEDGSISEFKYDADYADKWPKTIDGIDEEEIFDSVRYAG